MRFAFLKFDRRKNKNEKLKAERYLKETPYDDLPLVTVVLPVLNAEDSIQKAIESIQSQTYKKWELVIVDDGSEDGTIKLLASLANSEDRIRNYANNKNHGVAYSRNVGLFYAKGDYITFHDADDVSHPERLKSQLVELLADVKTQLSICKYVRVDKHNQVLKMNGRTERNYVSGMMFRSKVISSLGYFRTLTVSEDSEFHERIVAFFGKSARVIIDRVLYYASFNNESLLFSNADVSIKGSKVNYKIKQKDQEELEACRAEHKLIKHKKQSPYVEFSPNLEITKQVKK